MATAKATDRETSGPANATKIAIELPDVVRAQALLDIVDELDAQLVALGDPPTAQTDTLRYRLPALREQLATARSDAGTTRAARLGVPMSQVASGLRAELRKDQDADPSTPRGRALRRLDIWLLLVQPIEKIVDLPALVAQVCNSPAIRAEAAGISYRVDVLGREVGAHSQRILTQAQKEMDALTAARAQLARQVIDDLVEKRTAASPPTKAHGRLLPSFLHSGRAAAASAPTSGERSAEASRFAALEAGILETAAAANQVVSSAIELDARAVLSAHATDLKRTELRLAATDGLAQVVSDQLEVATEAADRLAKLLRRMRGGSVGIAGPRGAGKSTIIRRFCDGRESIGERPLLSVTVAAPVVYDSRDFTRVPQLVGR